MGEHNFYYKLPAYLEDLESYPGALDKWSGMIDQQVERRISDRKGKNTRFFNPARATDVVTDRLFMRWRAFPNNFSNQSNKYKSADKRENQDEYCEWEVERNNKGELLSVTFVTELPNYYEFIASTDESGDRLLRLYNDLNPNAEIKHDDIFDENGKYMPDNRWNIPNKGSSPETTGCIAHMVRKNNTLGDLVDLVVDSTILVKNPDYQDEYITTGRELLKRLTGISKESPNRNSDPAITGHINSSVREGNHVTITNPIGPYIHSFENEKIVYEDGKKVDKNMWTIQRGSKAYAVRAKFTVPQKWVGKLKEAGSNRKITCGSQIAQYVWIGVGVAVANSERLASASQGTQTIMTFIEGRHIKPVPLLSSFVDRELRNEPFGKYLATTPTPARTLRDLIATFPDNTWCAFAADEGIGYRFKTKRKDVRVRLVVICTPAHPVGHLQRTHSKMGNPDSLLEHVFKVPTIAVVVAPPQSDPNNVHSEKAILQVASFNPGVRWFNFYDRERFQVGAGAGQWIYFGNSKDAFAPDTQGLGPFCGHPSGSLTMKESEDPWPHWHTSDNPLDLPSGHPLLKDELFRVQNTRSWLFAGADLLARMVEIGTRIWFTERRLLDYGEIRDPKPEAQRVHQWVAHVCLTTTVTIACSRGGEGEFMIPSGFFFNAAALSHLIAGIQDVEDEIKPCNMENYQKAREYLGLVTLNDMNSQPGNLDIATKGEGLAPWKVIVPGREDIEGMKQMINIGLLPKRVLIALLMVDFWNPVFSYRRARLMRHIPSTVTYLPMAKKDDRYEFGKDLEETIDLAIGTLGLDVVKSPEAELLALLRKPNLEEHVTTALKAFVGKINYQLATPEGVLGYMKLAETKRCLFRPPPITRRPVHPLAEFDLQLPYASSLPATEVWAMKEDASVEMTGPEPNIWHPRNTQTHFQASGCPFSASF